MILWARLTWQAGDPAALCTDLAARLGCDVQRGGLVPDASLLDLGSAFLEVRPWVREHPGDVPAPGGRLVLEPVPGGEEAPAEPGPDMPARAGAPMVLVAVGWSTVELDRSEGEMEMWLESPHATEAADVPDPHLGATLRPRRPAGLPGRWLALLEPSTEGRVAASLARDGEGPCAMYLAPVVGLEAWLAAREGGARRLGSGVDVGAFGRQVVLGGLPGAGPQVIVTEGLTPRSAGHVASTIRA